MDTCGFAKDNFYYYQAWWGDRPALHLLPHWNWAGKEGQDIDVRCFGNCDEVELFLNGQSLGRKPMSHNSHLQWTVKYQPGTLLARGYSGGAEVSEDKVETTGAPAAIKLTPDRRSLDAGNEDASVITVSVVDDHGRVVPTAGNQISFDLTGPGRILGVGNGDPSCHEPDTFIPAQRSRTVVLNDWRMKKVPTTHKRPEVREDFDDTNWDTADVQSDSGPLAQLENAVYRTHVTLSQDDLASQSIAASFGKIDDDGWVYVNGHLAGESHDWSAQPSFEVRPYLHEGVNTIAVAVHNQEGPGGINNGVALEVQQTPEPVHWQRSVFNGLGQIIVQAGTQAGTLHLTATADGLQSGDVEITSETNSTAAVLP
jgi:beta-galactosidase